jgi:hypothetical protein
VHLRFMARTHRNALRDPQIPPDANTQVQRNVSRPTFLSIPYGTHSGIKNSASTVHAPDEPECTT